MYIALRHMLEQLPSGEIVKVSPGEQLHTFAAWPYQNKAAALANRMVAKVGEGEEVDADVLLAHEPSPVHKAEVDRAHGRVGRGPARAPAQAPVSAPALEQAPAPAPVPAPAREAAPVPEADLTVGTYACATCDYVGMTPAGLKIHQSRKHAG